MREATTLLTVCGPCAFSIINPIKNSVRADYINLPVQMIDNVEGPVHHLAYERGEDVIVMKGYKFAKAKTAAAAVLGCLALANPAVADQLVKVCCRILIITVKSVWSQ